MRALLTNIFCCTFLTNYASQSLQTWYGALARVPTRRLPNLGLQLISFLFYDLVYFLTLHGNMTNFLSHFVGVYQVSSYSQISCFLCRGQDFETPFLAHLSTTCSGRAIVTGHRPSSVRPSVRPSICWSVNNFFKNLLLQNQKANLDKTWQECSLGEALQKLLKEFNSNKNSGCHGNKMAENGKNL